MLSGNLSRPRRLLRKLKPTDWIALVALAVYVVAFSWMTIRRHNGFRTTALDLAKFDQMIWNASRGSRPYSTLTEQSFVQGHFSPGLVLYAPLFWLWSDIRLLFVAQSICVGVAPFLIYWYFRKEAPWLGLAVFVASLTHPSLHHVNLVEFRRVTTAIPAVSFALYHLFRRRYRWMLVGLAVALLYKENMAFLVIAVGLYVTLAQRSPKVGLPIAAVGLLWLALVPFVVVPAMGASYRVARKYFSYIGRSPAEMVSNLVRDPTLPLQYMLRPDRLSALLSLFWPMAFLFLLAPEIAAFTLPLFGYLLASKSDGMGQLEAWYPSVILPVLYWAVATGVRRLGGRWRVIALSTLLVCGLAGWILRSEVWPGRRFNADVLAVTDRQRQMAAVLREIPAESVVAAQDHLVPHLSHREQIYLFPWEPRDVPPDYAPDYVVLDREMGTWPVELDVYRTLFYDHLAGTTYEIEHQVGSMYVFRYAGEVLPDIVRRDQWDESLALLGYSVAAAPAEEGFAPIQGELPAGTAVRLALFWRVDEPVGQNYTVFVHLMGEDGHMLAQHDTWPADAHRPTSVLSSGDVIRDVHYLDVPEVIPVTAFVRVGLYEGISGRRLLLPDGQESVTLPLVP
jgi:uncharacterized membrane protein